MIHLTGRHDACMEPSMRTIVENLYTLQQLQLQTAPASTEREAQIRKLRGKIPPPVLSHFDRLLAIGRKGVALVQNGICRGCHLRVPSGIAASLARPKDLYLCDNCGAYLLVPLGEISPPVDSAPPIPVPARKKTRKKPVATAG
jgi:predicted  nucleic acid-binding Zn-ribbon protein